MMLRLRFLLGVSLALILTGCNRPEPNAIDPPTPSPLIGEWQAPASEESPTLSLTFREDNRFVMVRDGQDVPESEGSYSVSRNQVIVQNEGASATSDCTLSGMYAYTIDDLTLSFEPIQDDTCDSRSVWMGRKWTKK